MALNSSGPISLGGATTGQSINLELGVSATALASINSATFRALAGVASGQISLSSFYGKSNTTYYNVYTKPTASNNADFSGPTMIDASGNVYVYSTNQTPTYQGQFYKALPTASISYIKNVAAIGGFGSQNGAVDSSGNQYFINTTSSYQAVKMSTSGSPVYVTTFSFSGIRGLQPFNSAWVDSSNNLFSIVTYINSSKNTVYDIMKFNSSGTLQWAKNLSTRDFRSASTDAAGSVYLYGTSSAANNNFCIVKLDSSGAFVSQFSFCSATNVSINLGQGWGFYDSVNSVHYMAGGRGSDAAFAQLSSSLTVNWANYMSISHSYSMNYHFVCVDSSGNVYVTSNNYYIDANARAAFFAKYNSSGVLQWQRRIRISGGTSNLSGYKLAYLRGVSNSATGSFMVINGAYITSAGNERSAQFILPSDGSKTGTYTMADGVAFTYEATTGTSTSWTSQTQVTSTTSVTNDAGNVTSPTAVSYTTTDTATTTVTPTII